MAEAAPTWLAGGGDSGESRVVGDYTRPTHVHPTLPDAGEPNCVRTMNRCVRARICARGRERAR